MNISPYKSGITIHINEQLIFGPSQQELVTNTINEPFAEV